MAIVDDFREINRRLRGDDWWEPKEGATMLRPIIEPTPEWVESAPTFIGWDLGGPVSVKGGAIQD